ncbi:MAG: T9SS type A sorting domain-containing protein [Dysgonamonadaceae bacterium]|nr:T9SS type A sorting domain-containing protein [Dysgonamonadaceae bacterium]
MNVKADEYTYNDLYAGTVNIMGVPMELPDFGKWHYFAFDETQGVLFRGTSPFELENVVGNAGTEKINTEWQARTDWDFAFHAYDFRTNSGLAGNGNAGAIFIADAVSAAETPLDAVYGALTEAPAITYNADAVVTGIFYLDLTKGMPPLRATSLSVNTVTRKAANGATGASADFSTLAMSGGATDNPMIILLKTTSGKYVKMYLKQFINAEGKPGFLKFDYQFIPLAGTNGIPVTDTCPSTVYVNSASQTLDIYLPESAEVAIYNLAGLPVKRVKAPSGNRAIPVSGWEKGIYIVQIHSDKESRTQKIIVR